MKKIFLIAMAIITLTLSAQAQAYATAAITTIAPADWSIPIIIMTA